VCVREREREREREMMAIFVAVTEEYSICVGRLVSSVWSESESGSGSRLIPGRVNTHNRNKKKLDKH
jgi:hypothetical protein